MIDFHFLHREGTIIPHLDSMNLNKSHDVSLALIHRLKFGFNYFRIKSIYMKSLRVIIFLLFLAVISSCVTNPVTGKKQFGVASFEKEKAMGAEYDPQIVAAYGLYQDEEIQNYINSKGLEMANISHNPDYNYEFKIMDSPVVNAFAVPGGYVYFTRGIMAHFNNEAEFAGVLGHEIGHITARHSVKSQRDAILAQVGVIAGAIAAPRWVNPQSASQGAQLMLLKFGRDAESQSDELGVEYSTRIGYDAQKMAMFFNTLARKQAEAGVSIPEFLSTHPDPNNRREVVGQLAAAWKQQLNLNDPKVGRDSYLRMIDGLVYGEDPRQGFVESGAFYHPELEFEFDVPQGWNHQNSPQQFQMAPEDGSSMMFLTLAQGSTLAEAYSNTVQQYGLNVSEDRETSYNGLPVKTLIATQNPQQGQQAEADPIKIKMSLIEYNGLVYNLGGLTTTSAFSSMLPTFNSVMESFKPLNDPVMLNRQPEKIKVRSVNQAGTFSQVMGGFGVSSARMEEMAILNGMQQSDQLTAGMLIKTVE